MIVDLILDRKDGHPYRAKEFYDNVMAYEEGTDYDISRALDGGTEKDVKKALCDYIMGSYNPKICNYINKVQWLEDDANDKELNDSLSFMEEWNKFVNNEKVQGTFVSNGYVREQIIKMLKDFVSAVEDTINDYEKVDKELKL